MTASERQMTRAEKIQAAAAAAKRARSESLKQRSETTVLPTVRATTGGTGATADTAADLPLQGSLPVTSKSKRKEPVVVEDAELPPRKSKKRPSSEAVVNLEVVSPTRDQEVLTSPPRNQLSTSSQLTRSQALYFDPEFLKDPSKVSGWKVLLSSQMTEAPPLPLFAAPMAPEVRRVVGESLARRVAATGLVSEAAPVGLLEKMVAEFGVASHSLSTMMLSALESVRTQDARQKAAMAKREAEFGQLCAGLKEKVEAAKTAHLDHEKVIADLRSDAASKDSRIRTLEAQVKDSCDKLSGANSKLSTASTMIEKGRKEISDAVARAQRAEAQISELKTQAEAAAKESAERITALEGQLFNAYDQGMFHMSRCYTIGSGSDMNEVNFDVVAAWMAKNQYDEDLRLAHTWMPYGELDLIELNDMLLQKGLPEWTPPEVREVNLRTAYEQKVASLEAAAGGEGSSRAAEQQVQAEESEAVQGHELAKAVAEQDIAKSLEEGRAGDDDVDLYT